MINIIKKYWVILLIGLIIRVTVAAFSYHPDIKAQVVGSVSFLEGRLDPYQYARDLSPYIVLDKLPMSYLLELPMRFIFRPMTFGAVEKAFFLNTNELFGNSNLMAYLIYAKLPLILADLLLGVMLAMTVKIKQSKTLMLWVVNPFAIWVTSAIGQIDIYIAVSAVACWILIQKGRLNWAALVLGVGGAIKSGPFLLLPFLLGLAKNWKQRCLILLISALPIIVTVLPFLTSSAFKQDALFAPQLSKILYANIPISGGAALLLVPAMLLLIYCFFFTKLRQKEDFLKYSIVTFLMIFSFTHFHLQWFLWVMPLLLIWFNKSWKGLVLPVVLIGVSLLGMLFLFDSSLQLKLFAPLFPQLDRSQGFAEILSSSQVTFWRSIFASIFAAAASFIIWRVSKEEYDD